MLATVPDPTELPMTPAQSRTHRRVTRTPKTAEAATEEGVDVLFTSFGNNVHPLTDLNAAAAPEVTPASRKKRRRQACKGKAKGTSGNILPTPTPAASDIVADEDNNPFLLPRPSALSARVRFILPQSPIDVSDDDDVVSQPNAGPSGTISPPPLLTMRCHPADVDGAVRVNVVPRSGPASTSQSTPRRRRLSEQRNLTSSRDRTPRTPRQQDPHPCMPSLSSGMSRSDSASDSDSDHGHTSHAHPHAAPSQGTSGGKKRTGKRSNATTQKAGDIWPFFKKDSCGIRCLFCL